MKKNQPYVVYEGFTARRKKYLVFECGKFTYHEKMDFAKRFFKVSSFHLILFLGWIYRRKLYLFESPFEYPSKKAKRVIVVTMKNKELRQ